MRAKNMEPVRTILPSLDPRLQAAMRRHWSNIVGPLCDRQPSVPAVEESELAGVRIVHPCGMVAVGLEMTQVYQEFALAHCSTSDEQACSAGYARMFLARVTERYPLADTAWIVNHCTGYPDDCASFTAVEAHYLRTHNDAVRSALEAETAEISRRIGAEEEGRRVAEQAELARQAQEEERRQQAASERRSAKWRAVGEALQEYGQAQQQAADLNAGHPSVNCRSRTIGATVYTNCR
jgi:hypothetical protein